MRVCVCVGGGGGMCLIVCQYIRESACACMRHGCSTELGTCIRNQEDVAVQEVRFTKAISQYHLQTTVLITLIPRQFRYPGLTGGISSPAGYDIRGQGTWRWRGPRGECQEAIELLSEYC